MRGAEAERRPQTEHVPVGRVHHRLGLPFRQEDPLQVSDSRSAGGGQMQLPRRGKDGGRHQRGQTSDQGEVRGANHTRV